MADSRFTYRGRFAPSPTGPLHFGSLIAALGSYLEAKTHGGQWLLRMEDVDAPRCSAAAAGEILRALKAFGLTWDGEAVWQSRRTDAYAAALERLKSAGHVFPCGCTRRELADSAIAPDGATIYPGTCRQGLAAGREARASRLRVGNARIGFDDAIQGRIDSDLAREAGDFILFRADGVFAYQLAVVVDDAAAGITHVVRGADLLASTPRQIFLQQCLGCADAGLCTPAGGGECRRGEAVEADTGGAARQLAARSRAASRLEVSRPASASRLCPPPRCRIYWPGPWITGNWPVSRAVRHCGPNSAMRGKGARHDGR
jgi:glutamyl-queuosine tRNA(Asp) synthetase